MFGKQFPEGITKTCNIIDNAFSEFEKRGYSVKWAGSKNFEEYGFNLFLPNEGSLFFGIWFAYWLTSGNPVCICIDSEDQTQVQQFNSIVERTNLAPAIELEKFPVTYFDQTKLMDKDCEGIIFKTLMNFCTTLNALTVNETVTSDNEAL